MYFIFRYRAVYAYRPQNDDELELLEGDEVYVMEKCDDGWYVGTSNRTAMFGTFPGNYVQLIQCEFNVTRVTATLLSAVLFTRLLLHGIVDMHGSLKYALIHLLVLHYSSFM